MCRAGAPARKAWADGVAQSTGHSDSAGLRLVRCASPRLRTWLALLGSGARVPLRLIVSRAVRLKGCAFVAYRRATGQLCGASDGENVGAQHRARSQRRVIAHAQPASSDWLPDPRLPTQVGYNLDLHLAGQ